MTTFLRDIRFGVRLLLRNPGFAAVAVLALALGIGATTAIFSVVYATLLAPLPYPQPDQLVMVWSRVQGNRNVSAAATYLEWKRRSRAFQSLHAWTGGSVNLATADRPEQVPVATTTPGFLSMTGSPLAFGRDFRPEEGQVGRDQVVILTNQLWRERFGGDSESSAARSASTRSRTSSSASWRPGSRIGCRIASTSRSPSSPNRSTTISIGSSSWGG
jgi:putative ABC transport system permease protein